MVVRLDRTRSLNLGVKCASSCFVLLSLLARLGCTERSVRLARTTITLTPRSVNDVEVRSISNLLVDYCQWGLWSVSCSCDLLLWLWIGPLQVPGYRCEFRSVTVLRVQHYCAYSSVRKFNDMDQTRCPMLLYFLLYGALVTNSMEKKEKELM